MCEGGIEGSAGTACQRGSIPRPSTGESPILNCRASSVMGAATLAGSETTALATAWLLHLLAGDPAAYARARAEVIGRVSEKAASARTCLLRVSRPSRRLGDHSTGWHRRPALRQLST